MLSTIARRQLLRTSLSRAVTATRTRVGDVEFFSSLPSHQVMGMPALSPTMESGSIAKWNVSEGDAFAAGDSLAEIETDKATVDFEAQDDGVVAKILAPANAGDVPVNAPILVTVEEEEDVAAFADYEATAAAEEETTATAEAQEEPTTTEERVTPPAAPEPVPAATPTPTLATVPPPEPEVVAVPDTTASPVTKAWGRSAETSSPVANLLAAAQREYVEKFGSTGQVPLRPPE